MEEQASQSADEEQCELRIAKLDELATELKQLEQSLGTGQDAQSADAPPLARRRAQLVASEARLEEEAERLEARRQLTRIQRRPHRPLAEIPAKRADPGTRCLSARIEARPAAIAARSRPLG